MKACVTFNKSTALAHFHLPTNMAARLQMQTQQEKYILPISFLRHAHLYAQKCLNKCSVCKKKFNITRMC